jgi:hypothetical protein
MLPQNHRSLHEAFSLLASPAKPLRIALQDNEPSEVMAFSNLGRLKVIVAIPCEISTFTPAFI